MTRPPTVFLSWAHRHREWSPARAEQWERTVVEFAYLLRRCGVEVVADVFEYSTRGIDWTRFGTSAIADVDTVVIVGNEAYWERWEGRNPPGEGAGVARETDALHGLFDADQRAFQQKTIIVLLPGETDHRVPHDLRRIPRYPVTSLTVEGAEDVLRRLLDRPKYPKAGLGEPPELPASGLTPPTPPPSGPDQLPADLPDFTGRARELDQLDSLLDPSTAVVISAVDGTAGVGKTSLAVHWAHRVRDRFPDGRLHIDLQGFAPVPPLRPRRALGNLLRALGVADQDLPATLDGRSTLLRRLLAGRRALILLDNAADVDQVRPLLPASPTCLALITSRSRLTGLAVRDGARLLNLDVLTPDESLSLLRRVLGSRVDAEPAAAARVAELCGHLPLALRIVAVRLLTRPSFRIEDAVAELSAETGRIEALSRDDDEHAAVRSVFSWSYQRLAEPQRRTFRLLGLHRGPSLGRSAVAALTGSGHREAQSDLDTLATLHLIEEDRPGRFRIHDLLRLYAAELCRTEEPADERHAAVERLLYWYVSTANAADSLLRSGAEIVTPPKPVPDVRPQEFDSEAAALAWFDDEAGTMLDIAQQGLDEQLHDLCWRLPLATWPFFQRRSRWSEWMDLQGLGLTAARNAHDEQAQAWLLSGLGDVLDDLERYDEAIALHQDAARLHRRLGNRLGEATAVNNLAVSLDNLERYDEAIEQYLVALGIFREIGGKSGAGMVLNNLGSAHLMKDDLDIAADYLRQAVDLRQEIDNTFGLGMSLHNLGEVDGERHQYRQACEWFRRAIAVHRQAGHARGEARAHHRLGDMHDLLDEPAAARANWETAYEIFDRLGDPEADEILATLEDRGPAGPAV